MRFLGLAALWVSASVAAAPRVLVLTVNGDAPTAASLEVLQHAAEDALDRAARFEVVHPEEAWEPSAATTRAAALEEARRHVAEGQKAIDDLDAVKAAQLFTDAMTAARKADLARPEVFDLLVRAWVLRAAAHVANGDNAGAKSEIEKILPAAPKAVFPDALFPPDVLKFAESTRRNVVKATGELSLDTEPKGARLFIDGVDRGRAPVKVPNMAGGRHIVVASLTGYSKLVTDSLPGEDVLRLQPAENLAKLKALRERISKGFNSGDRDLALRELGKTVLADQVLLVFAKQSVNPGKLELTVERIEVSDGHNPGWAVAVVSADDSDALGTTFDAVVAKDAPRDGKSPVTHVGSSGGPLATYAGVGLIGVGVLAIGAGVLLGLQASARVNDFKRNPQVRNQVSKNFEVEGRTFAALADFSYIVGAVAAAGGGAILLLNRKGSGSSGEPIEAAPEPKKQPAGDAPVRLEQPDAPKQAEPGRDEKKQPEPPSREDSKQAADDKKKAEEQRKADEKNAADDKKKAEEQRKADEKKAAEEAKKAEEQRKADEKKAAEDKKKAEEQRKADEKKAAADAKKNEKKGADDAKKAEEEAKKKAAEEEAKKKAAEEEKKRAAEEKKKKEEEEAAERRKKEAEEKRKKESEEDLRNF